MAFGKKAKFPELICSVLIQSRSETKILDDEYINTLVRLIELIKQPM